MGNVGKKNGGGLFNVKLFRKYILPLFVVVGIYCNFLIVILFLNCFVLYTNIILLYNNYNKVIFILNFNIQNNKKKDN